MPVHDWTRVVAGNFHDFHQAWIVAIRDSLNGGRMPDDYYAMSEQVAEGPIPDVIALEARDHAALSLDTEELSDRAIGVIEHPPKVKYTEAQERELYADKADHVAVYHANGDRIVAYIEIVSPGNKHSPLELKKFIEKCNDALERGVHLLIIDILPPRKHDPKGIHAALWDYRYSESHGVTPDEPLGLSAYRVDDVPRAYFQPTAVGQPLPEMPIFLTPLHYINVPLEQTYQEAYRGVPQRWKRVIEGDSAA
jgi:hypothetical protein